jgi:hypothetical protein
LLSPVDSVLKYYQKGEPRPDSCIDNCLCLTYKSGLLSKETACQNINVQVSLAKDFTLPTDLQIKYNGNSFEISNVE